MRQIDQGGLVVSIACAAVPMLAPRRRDWPAGDMTEGLAKGSGPTAVAIWPGVQVALCSGSNRRQDAGARKDHAQARIRRSPSTDENRPAASPRHRAA